MTRDFIAAQMRARRIADDFMHRLGTKHRDCTPSEAVMAMATLVKGFDALNAKNGAPSRTLQDLMIAMLGGIQAVDWSPLNAMQSAEEAPDVLGAGDDLILESGPEPADKNTSGFGI